MVILENSEEFKNRFKMGKKWMRCTEAIQNIPNLKPCQFYSIGDSLIYLLDNGCLPKEPRFIGHRRYMDIYYITEGNCNIEYALKTSLTPVEHYSDETDCEYFDGTGESICLNQGNLIIFEPEDAHRISSRKSGCKLILKVTVENNTFLNK